MLAEADGRAAGDADRHRLGGVDRDGGARRRWRPTGIEAAVVSLPCWELFAAQDAAYRAGVLGGAPRVGIEAAGGFGWDRWLGPDGVFIGMTGFRRIGAGRGAIQAFRHHRRGGRGRGTQAARLSASGEPTVEEGPEQWP